MLCFGTNNDDKEFIDVINEASIWASGIYLRKIFSSMLLNNSITRPLYVWEQTWMHLSDEILMKQKHISGNLGAISLHTRYLYIFL